MPFAPGENVGPYRIVEKLGQGGMATVFKAYHAALDRHVAIKVLHPAFKEDPHFLARFLREARVVARLDHPNIVPIYDFAEHRGHPYLVMKFVEGETLKARLERGPLAPDHGVRILRAVSDALSYAHNQGVLHRDVKPSNILIAEDGGIYLADFGLARIAAAGESTLSGEVLLGTPQYISPEQARGAENLDEATDQYSLGIVLYELVVGRVPYNADTPFSIVHDHIYSPLPLPREINPRVPPGVERVLLKALAKAPGDRYASVAAMVEAFLRQLPEEHAMAAMGKEDPLELNGEALEAASEGARAGFMNRAHPKGEPVGHESPAQKWTWMAVGLLLACIALLALVLLASKAPLGSLTGRETGSGAVGRLEALPGSQALREALRQVSQHPGDPELRLELASHLEEEGYPGHAAEQYTRAGQLLLRQSRFLEAGKASLSALQLTGGPAESDQEVLGLAEEALYRSAEKEGFAELFVDLVGQFPQWGLVPVLEARHISRSVEPERGAQALVEHLDEHPGDAFALAALAEIEATSGNLREAERALKRALEQPGIPDWLRDHLNALERELGKGQD